jgi:hypothetical protein
VSRATCCRACLRRRSLGGGSQRGPSKSRGWLRCCNRTVKAMCKANWPAQGRPTEGEQAVPKAVTTRGLEGVPPRKEGVASPKGARGQNRRCGRYRRALQRNLPTHFSQAQSTKNMGAYSPSHPRPPAQWLIFAISSPTESRTRGSVRASPCRGSGCQRAPLDTRGGQPPPEILSIAIFGHNSQGQTFFFPVPGPPPPPYIRSGIRVPPPPWFQQQQRKG